MSEILRVDMGVIRSFEEIFPAGTPADTPVVTLFSGGLDSTYLLYRLKSLRAKNVHALTVELGEDESRQTKQEICDQLGIQLHVVDARERFVEDFVWPAIAAQAVYLDTHPISSSLSRPLIAEVAQELAESLGAPIMLHTANRSQNTLRRLNGAFALLGYKGRYGSPYDLDPIDREQKIVELKAAGLHQMSERHVSGDSNLWCREFESGFLDDPEDHRVPEHMYQWSEVANAIAKESVQVSFVAGRPTAVNGVEMPLMDLISVLNRQCGAYGIGRYSGLEHLEGDVKVLELREMPAAWILLKSFRHLETAVLSSETIREKMHTEQVWVREALEGRWFGELRAAAQAFVGSCAAKVTGSVRWRLSVGQAQTDSITADQPLYVRNREAWETESIWLERSSFRAAASVN
ncbi:argininosuccinate synthase-related protein [Streptomyces beijiangensis]|uniref:argininosuccinate synthase n=1 Tax=Streptomyces beijiangensis TaxID=163361 RepID=A0A939FA10_9ACTN|nr:argininosuccinate synthase-related protein [Streptomyces beijiangensis]MBO0514359.1 argininosuccinate synthase-related protein [Streptomyces beijiangensis]